MLETMELPVRAGRRKRETNLTELLARANHLIGESLYDGLKGHGVSAAEWRVLGALSEVDGLRMAQLAESVMFKQPTLTKVVDRMERGQLVQRRAAPEDRRCTIVELTDRGHALATPLALRRRRHEAALRRTLGATASREVRAALATLVDRLSHLPRSPIAQDVGPAIF